MMDLTRDTSIDNVVNVFAMLSQCTSLDGWSYCCTFSVQICLSTQLVKNFDCISHLCLLTQNPVLYVLYTHQVTINYNLHGTKMKTM